MLWDNVLCFQVHSDFVVASTRGAMAVIDGNIMTSRGPGTALCFGLEIVKRFSGEESYNAVKEGMLLDFCK